MMCLKIIYHLQICIKLAGGATHVWNGEHKVPNLLSGDDWIGYDDEESLTLKVMSTSQLKGTMFYRLC